MTFCEELYFDIKLVGAKSEIRKFISFLKSGELDEFFEISQDYIDTDDSYATASDDEEVSLTFTNDDYGVEIDEFDSDEFLDVFCRAAENLEIHGRIFDIDDDEYSFISAKGDSYYLNAKKINHFNDELDEQAILEDQEED